MNHYRFNPQPARVMAIATAVGAAVAAITVVSRTISVLTAFSVCLWFSGLEILATRCAIQSEVTASRTATVWGTLKHLLGLLISLELCSRSFGGLVSVAVLVILGRLPHICDGNCLGLSPRYSGLIHSRTTNGATMRGPTATAPSPLWYVTVIQRLFWILLAGFCNSHDR